MPTARQPHAELYTGLVEVGVGLLPGGGGCKEMTAARRSTSATAHPSAKDAARSVEMMEAMKQSLRNRRHGEGFDLGARSPRISDSSRRVRPITMNRERVLSDAKARALELVARRLRAPCLRTDIPRPAKASWPR